MNLSKEASKNTASISALDFIETNNIDFGVELIIHKGIPLQSGMGSSAASAVAGVVAVNALLDEPLGKKDLLMHAIEGEKFASAGLHADNVAPSLFGGLVFCPQDELPNTIQLNLPNCISSMESYYATNQFPQALEQFTKVIEIYPRSRKVSDALLKIGYCHYELGNWGDARAVFTKIQNDYSDSTVAKLAEQRIKVMNDRNL